MSGGGPAGEVVVDSEDVVRLIEPGASVVEEVGADNEVDCKVLIELCEGRTTEVAGLVDTEVGVPAEDPLLPLADDPEPAEGADERTLLPVAVEEVDAVLGLCNVGSTSPLVLEELVMLLELGYPTVTVEVAVIVVDGPVMLEKLKKPGPKVKMLVV